MRSTTGKGRRREGGTAMVTVVGALASLIAVSALAIDVGLIWTARNQLQNVADAAALAGAATMIDLSGPSVTLASSDAAIADIAGRHSAVATASVAIDPGDVTYGSWDPVSRSFDGAVDLSDPDQVSAVSVAARLDGGPNSPVPAFMSRILGRNAFDVGADATAYLGFAGSAAPGMVNLPIVIDCCKLKGASCSSDYCATVASNPPNPCPLDSPQMDGITEVSCLQFQNTADQNACWTEFESSSSAVNTSDLIHIVENDVQVEVSVSYPIYVDNGDKTPMISEINDRFQGNGAYPGDGIDRYEPKDGVADSWVVALPVIECQTGIHCSGGSPAKIVGAVCFEVREVVVTPDKIIRGRFLCESDPLYDECDLGPTVTGGLDFGIRADIPVLVR